MEAGSRADQQASAGVSLVAIHDRALQLARPEPGLRWLDVGCGTGDLLRRVRDEYAPASLTGTDVLPWLADDLRADVDFREQEPLTGVAPADRVVLIESIEHLQAPWRILSEAAALVAPGGRIVVSTPNLATLRNRLDLLVRGQLTSFRPDNAAHLSPALPHVTTRTLAEAGLLVDEPLYAAADVIPLTGGRNWPDSLAARFGRLLNVSVVIGASAPSAGP